MNAMVGGVRGPLMDWARVLAYMTGTVDQELLARNEYLAAENRILKAQLMGRLKLSDAERSVLGEISSAGPQSASRRRPYPPCAGRRHADRLSLGGEGHTAQSQQ